MTAFDSVILDPHEVSTNRTELDLTSSGLNIDAAGIDWGEAAITAYEAEMEVGSAGVDYRLPNRNIVIPLGLGMDYTNSFDVARKYLRQKVGLLQREGGFLKRQTGLYAEIVSASLILPDKYGESAGLEEGSSLTLECLPDFFGDEITLDSATFTSSTGGGAFTQKFSSTLAAIAGDYPGRCRIKITDTSGNNKNGMIWGFRAKHYDSATTAALSYEAEALSPVGGASVTTLSGASGGSVIAQTSMPAASWVTVMSTNLAAGTMMTHQGSYRMWARVYAGNTDVNFRLLWGNGSLSVPIANDIVDIPGSGAFYLIDLGEIRIDPAPLGSAGWLGGIQAYTASGAAVYIDKIWYQPLDEAAGTAVYNNVISPAVVISPPKSAQTIATASAGSTTPWTVSGTGGSVTLGVGNSHPAGFSDWLEGTGLGFAIPSSATIEGIEVDVYCAGLPTYGSPQDNGAELIKAGALVGTNKAVGLNGVPLVSGALGAVATYVYWSYGGPTDLWGTTWTPAQVNASNFGFGLLVATPAANGSSGMNVAYMRITIYYGYSGFVIPVDAVVYASGITEFRTEGAYRAQNGSSVYGKVGNPKGQLPRIPPSGMENRAVELFVKPTRGDLDQLPDTGIDAFTAQVIYRPSYLHRS